MKQTRESFCRMCTTGCGIEVDVQDNLVVSVRGDDYHAISQGYICIKGSNSIRPHNGEDRLIST
jgi:anaerobic selenocysteine-containing dehydrogenase